MPFLRNIYYRLDKNYHDILSFKYDFQYKLKWNAEQYEKLKQESFYLTEISYKLIDNFNDKEFWLLADHIENLYKMINNETNIIFGEENMLHEEMVYRYLIRLKSIVTDINYLKKRLKNKSFI